MSSSGTGAAAAPAPVTEQVADFVYQIAGVGGAQGAAAKQDVPGATKEPGDGFPRINEKELSRLVAEARAEGFREGENEARKVFEQELAKQQNLLSSALSSFKEERENYYSKVEPQVVHLSLAIAGKILHREAQVDRMVVAGLVKVTLERMQQTTKAIIRIRPEEALSWRHYFNTNPDLEVVEDPALEPNACRIETELGVAEMGLDAQLKEVENGFFDLLAQRPGAQ